MIQKLEKKHIIEYKKIIRCLWNDISDKDIEEILDEYHIGKSMIFVYLHEESVVGFINLTIRNDYVEGCTSLGVGYIEGIYVCDMYRRNKIAYNLVGKAIDYFKSLGLNEIGSDTEIENKMSQIFHDAVGFRDVGTMKHYIMKIGD